MNIIGATKEEYNRLIEEIKLAIQFRCTVAVVDALIEGNTLEIY